MEITLSQKGPGQNKWLWNEDEDRLLIESLLELDNEGTFKAEGNFKPGHLRALEKKLHDKLPNCDKLAKPHIESRLRTFKSNFQIVHEKLTGTFCSGFGWDPDRKTVTADKPVWDEYLKSHKEATPFKTKAFPYYEELCMVYGRDRATGRLAEDLEDVVEEIKRQRESEREQEREFDVGLDDDDAYGKTNTTSSENVDQPRRSTKRKREWRNSEIKEQTETIAAAIKEASKSLSDAIGEDPNTKYIKRLGTELENSTSLTISECHRAADKLMQNKDKLYYFLGLSAARKDGWIQEYLYGQE